MPAVQPFREKCTRYGYAVAGPGIFYDEKKRTEGKATSQSCKQSETNLCAESLTTSSRGENNQTISDLHRRIAALSTRNVGRQSQANSQGSSPCSYRLSLQHTNAVFMHIVSLCYVVMQLSFENIIEPIHRPLTVTLQGYPTMKYVAATRPSHEFKLKVKKHRTHIEGFVFEGVFGVSDTVSTLGFVLSGGRV